MQLVFIILISKVKILLNVEIKAYRFDVELTFLKEKDFFNLIVHLDINIKTRSRDKELFSSALDSREGQSVPTECLRARHMLIEMLALFYEHNASTFLILILLTYALIISTPST